MCHFPKQAGKTYQRGVEFLRMKINTCKVVPQDSKVGERNHFLTWTTMVNISNLRYEALRANKHTQVTWVGGATLWGCNSSYNWMFNDSWVTSRLTGVYNHSSIVTPTAPPK